MYIIDKNAENEIIIKKSRFITKLYYIEDVNKVNDIINELKKEYKKCTHICYSYIIGPNAKAVDDGEIRDDINIEASAALFLNIGSGIGWNMIRGGSLTVTLDIIEKQYWELYKHIRKIINFFYLKINRPFGLFN